MARMRSLMGSCRSLRTSAAPQDEIVAALHWDFALAVGLTLIAFLAQ